MAQAVRTRASDGRRNITMGRRQGAEASHASCSMWPMVQRGPPLRLGSPHSWNRHRGSRTTLIVCLLSGRTAISASPPAMPPGMRQSATFSDWPQLTPETPVGGLNTSPSAALWWLVLVALGGICSRLVRRTQWNRFWHVVDRYASLLRPDQCQLNAPCSTRPTGPLIKPTGNG